MDIWAQLWSIAHPQSSCQVGGFSAGRTVWQPESLSAWYFHKQALHVNCECFPSHGSCKSGPRRRALAREALLEVVALLDQSCRFTTD